ncbi:MAG: hypothetical protein ACI4D8_09615 [Wujia sp.]
MEKATGVYTSQKKDGSTYYRVSITYRRKHISLGSYPDYEAASAVYTEGRNILDNSEIGLNDYSDICKLPHDKFIILINFRDNGIYFTTPIYLRKQYFEYYLSSDRILKFDRDDLFFYAAHKIQQKGGYLFVCDYGSQYKILTRYGIRPFAVYGRDYVMSNGDTDDYRYSNIRILNTYTGVIRDESNNTTVFTATIHIRGNYIVGRYSSEVEAAIAYNKAVDTLHANGSVKKYIKNYIVGMDKAEYIKLYNEIGISDNITNIKL